MPVISQYPPPRHERRGRGLCGPSLLHEGVFHDPATEGRHLGVYAGEVGLGAAPAPRHDAVQRLRLGAEQRAAAVAAARVDATW